MAQDSGIFMYFKKCSICTDKTAEQWNKGLGLSSSGMWCVQLGTSVQTVRRYVRVPCRLQQQIFLNSTNSLDCAASQLRGPNFFTITHQAVCTNIHFIIMTVYSALTHCASSFPCKIQQQMTIEQNST
jgi:hypothetical protein